MPQDHITTHWREGLNFESFSDGFSIHIDEHKGDETRRGPGPKKLLLVSLAGCTGMDVAHLLKKMRIEVDSFDLDVKADKTDEHPKTYSRIYLTYIFTGKDLKKEKIQKAVDLSFEKYCGVSAMLKAHCPIDVEIEYRNS